MSLSQHVFLSYRSLERYFAVPLAADLRAAGVQVWVDALPGGIALAEHWPQSIEEAVSTCRALIAVVSPEYVRSKICRRELDRAATLSKPIFPVLLSPVPPEDWPLQLESKQYVDFTLWSESNPLPDQTRLLIDALSGDLEEIVGQRPDPEQRYLLRLIGRLEAQRGVSNYIEFASSLRDVESDAPAGESVFDAWSLEPELALLERRQPSRDGGSTDTEVPIGNLQELISTRDRFVLLGAPGAGKSTTLRKIALKLARARLTNEGSGHLPLLLNLAAGRESEDILDIARREWPFDTDLEPALRSGDVLLLLDGLNEMGKGAGPRLLQLRAFLSSARGPKHVVAACRLEDYAGDLDLGIARVKLHPLGAAQVKQFVEAYLADRTPEFLAELKVDQATDHGLAAFAENPYLLVCLIVIFRNSEAKVGRRLPRNKGILFKDLIKVLWAREEARKTANREELKGLETGLSMLAYRMIAEDLGTSVPVSLAASELGGIEMLHLGVRTGVLRRDGEYVFYHHQLVQDCFAARELANHSISEHLSEPRFNVDIRWLVNFRIARPWDEALVALAGIASDSSAVIAEIAQVDPYLAARCVSTGLAVEQPVLSTLLQALLVPLADPEEVSRHDSIWDLRDDFGPTAMMTALGISDPDGLRYRMSQWRGRREASIRAFGELGKPGLDALHAALTQASSARCVQALLRAIGAVGSAASLPFVAPLVSHEDESVRYYAADTLGRLDAPAALEALLVALRDESLGAPRAAAKSLGQLGDTRAIPHLLGVLSSTNETMLLQYAVESLEKLAAGDAAADAMRERLARTDESDESLVATTLRRLLKAIEAPPEA